MCIRVMVVSLWMANLSILIEPFLPFTAEKIRRFIGFSVSKWSEIGTTGFLKPGHAITRPDYLFEKISDETIQAQIDKLVKTKDENRQEGAQVEPAKEEISFDDFTRMDIRVGTILNAEKVAKTKKLLKLEIDTGLDKRTVVSGIAEYFTPDEVVGKQVCVLINLAPRKIKNIESRGMILMAEDDSGRLYFVSPGDKVPEGCTVR